jgi:hypothetical protein
MVSSVRDMAIPVFFASGLIAIVFADSPERHFFDAECGLPRHGR